jgi:hypothetical protein
MRCLARCVAAEGDVMTRHGFLFLAMCTVFASCGGDDGGQFRASEGFDAGADASGTGGQGTSSDASAPVPCEDGCASGMRCDPLLDRCVACLFDHDCGAHAVCLADRTCEARVSCTNSLDCRDAPRDQTICDESAGFCVQCVVDADCGPAGRCENATCETFTPCDETSECEDGAVCLVDPGRCVACLSDGDCGDGKKCLGNDCRIVHECSSDNDCTEHGLLCDTAAGYCAECRRHSDCPEVYHCHLGECAPDVCESGQTACESGAIVICKTAGDGFDNPQPCAQGACIQRGATAACETPDGGAGDGGAADGASTCTAVYYRDDDGDGFGDPEVTLTACTAPAGYVDNADDCYDHNGDAKPGQTEYFDVHRGDGSFDYDCAGGETPRYPDTGACGGSVPTCTLTQGWDGSVPACGTTSGWITGCDGVVTLCDKETEVRVQQCR